MDITLNKILCPVDFSETSMHALTYAEGLAEKYGSELMLLHVVEPFFAVGAEEMMAYSFPNPADLAKDAARGLKSAIAGRPAERLGARLEVVIGRPFADIVRIAREQDTDLIVMGSHGRSGLAHLLIGSVAEKVVRKAPCPVLTVKAEGHEFVHP